MSAFPASPSRTRAILCSPNKQYAKLHQQRAWIRIVPWILPPCCLSRLKSGRIFSLSSLPTSSAHPSPLFARCPSTIVFSSLGWQPHRSYLAVQLWQLPQPPATPPLRHVLLLVCRVDGLHPGADTAQEVRPTDMHSLIDRPDQLTRRSLLSHGLPGSGLLYGSEVTSGMCGSLPRNRNGAFLVRAASVRLSPDLIDVCFLSRRNITNSNHRRKPSWSRTAGASLELSYHQREPAGTAPPPGTSAPPPPPPAEGSGGPGRRRAAALRRATEADRSLCPAKLTACKIEGSVDGYEVRLSRPDRRRQGQGLTPPSSSPVHRHADRARVVRWLPARNFLP